MNVLFLFRDELQRNFALEKFLDFEKQRFEINIYQSDIFKRCLLVEELNRKEFEEIEQKGLSFVYKIVDDSIIEAYNYSLTESDIIFYYIFEYELEYENERGA